MTIHGPARTLTPASLCEPGPVHLLEGERMSLYNMMHGVSPATFFVLPMLGKHPDEYPRFRDCFISNEEHPQYDNHIHVYTRTGGGNRDDYEAEIEAMRALPEYVTDFDDSFDSTYASFVFRIPERWQADFARIVAGDVHGISPEYQAELRRVFPKLADKFDEIFASSTTEAT